MRLVIAKCDECPCRREDEKTRRCAVANPPNRPIPADVDRASFCPLRKEQIILKEKPEKK